MPSLWVMHHMRTPEGLHLYISLSMTTKVLPRRASHHDSAGSEGRVPSMRHCRYGKRQSGKLSGTGRSCSMSMALGLGAVEALEPEAGSAGEWPIPPSSSKSTEGLWRSLTKTFDGTVAHSDAIFVSASAALLYFLNTWLSSRSSNFPSKRQTSLQYASILGSWQLDSCMAWSMMSLESPQMLSRLILSSTAMWRPLTRASYSTTLFQTGKWIWMVYHILTPRGEMKMRPTLAPVFIKDPSKYKV